MSLSFKKRQLVFMRLEASEGSGPRFGCAMAYAGFTVGQKGG